LSAFIRWISGGSYQDVRTVVAGVSTASFYRLMYCCAIAIVKCNSLAYSFPTTVDEIIEAAANFKNISANELLVGCVGVMDGLLIHYSLPQVDITGVNKQITYWLLYNRR
jgi:hypothetical protein